MKTNIQNIIDIDLDTEIDGEVPELTEEQLVQAMGGAILSAAGIKTTVRTFDLDTSQFVRTLDLAMSYGEPRSLA
jgi:hypothetical protein